MNNIIPKIKKEIVDISNNSERSFILEIPKQKVHIWHKRHPNKKLILNYDIPNTIFVVNCYKKKIRDCYIFATKTKLNAKLTNPLYEHNLCSNAHFDDGRICWGNVKINVSKTLIDNVFNIPNLYFNSVFTDAYGFNRKNINNCTPLEVRIKDLLVGNKYDDF